MYKFCVVGNPIAHSKSPWIHQQFARQFNLLINYEKIEIQPGHFATTIQNFIQQDGKGMNVTAPCKAEAFNIADYPSERAKQTGVASFLIFKNNKIYADNADGISLTKDITVNLGYSLKNKKILILGAGGAATGILPALLSEHPHSIIIANHSLDKAQLLAKQFQPFGKISASSYSDLNGEVVDVILDTTSCWQSMLPIPDFLQLTADALCYDLKYNKEPTLFMQWAQKRNVANIADGIGMLIEHNAIAFQLWTSKKPDTAPVIAAARQAFF